MKILKIEKTVEMIYTGDEMDMECDGDSGICLEGWAHNAEFRIFFDNGKCIHKPCTSNPLEEQMLLKSLIAMLNGKSGNDLQRSSEVISGLL